MQSTNQRSTEQRSTEHISLPCCELSEPSLFLFSALRRLPERFGELSQLKALWLVSNELSSLPYSLGSLQALEQLEVSGNQLQERLSE